MARRQRKQESAWPAVLAFGAFAGVIGAVVYANRVQAAPVAPPPAAPPAATAPPLPTITFPTIPPITVPSLTLPAVPAPLPALSPGTSYTELVTDPIRVGQVQNEVASKMALSNNLGIKVSDYGPADVDGNPGNPNWMRVLMVIQNAINVALPAFVLTGQLPTGFPSALRTDGVLDVATMSVIMD